MIVAVFHPPPIYLLGAWIRISEVLSIYLQYWSGASPLSLALSLDPISLSLWTLRLCVVVCLVGPSWRCARAQGSKRAARCAYYYPLARFMLCPRVP